ncbi:MAG TPA: hypothetical protein VK886_03330 [Vicinamibacterales bacterium]|nr:hypothetical protein [Vicinamibacterales bacterium]
MNAEDEPPVDSLRLTLGRVTVVVSGYTIAALGYGYVVWKSFGSTTAGLLGDMYGAFNAFVSGIAMFGVIAAIWLQRDQNKMQAVELRLQREELKDTREELRGQREALEAQNAFSAKQVAAAHEQLARWDKDYIERNKPVVFCDRWEHPEKEGNYHYVVRNVGGGFAVNVYFIDTTTMQMTPLALGSLAANDERRVPPRVANALATATTGLGHLIVAEGAWSRTTQWTTTLNFRTADNDIRQGHVQHRLALVTVEPPRGESQRLSHYLANNGAGFLEQLGRFGTSAEAEV